jgi:hypothetical protein
MQCASNSNPLILITHAQDVSDGAQRAGLFSFGKRSATFKRRFQEQPPQQTRLAAAAAPVAATAIATATTTVDQPNVKRRATGAAPPPPPPPPPPNPQELFRRAFEANEYKKRLQAMTVAIAEAPKAPSSELVKHGIAVGAQWTLARRQLQQSLEATQQTTSASLSALVDAQARLAHLAPHVPRAQSATLPSFDAWRRQCR